MMPALLRYVQLYERRQSSNSNNNNSSISKSFSSAVTVKDKGVSSSSSIVTKPNTASSSMHKEKEKGGVLVACVSGSTGRGETNYAVNCLLELFERSKRRPLPDSGVPLPPPPLLFQTLLWLLIRCEDGEKELVRILQPCCEKAMKGGSEEDRESERERDGVSAALSLTLSRPSSMPDLDLDFLLRECHR
jgi:hypothetical protein